jgi:hypothetical protein
VFRYQVSPTPGTYTEQDSVSQSSFPNDIAIRTQLWIDPDPTRKPAETQLTSRVFLRNQNRPPSATLDVTASGTTVALNASASSDPESYPLSYRFVDTLASVPAKVPACLPAADSTCGWGTTATLRLTPGVGVHQYWVQARDTGGLTTDSTKYTVTCTVSTCTVS